VLSRDIEKSREFVTEFHLRAEETGKRVNFFAESNASSVRMLLQFRRMLPSDFAHRSVYALMFKNIG
jgi:hypothetical protein